MSRVGTLPKIEHPLSRPKDPDTISVKGSSRMSSRSSLMSVPLPQNLSEQSCNKSSFSTYQNQAIPEFGKILQLIKMISKRLLSYVKLLQTAIYKKRFLTKTIC